MRSFALGSLVSSPAPLFQRGGRGSSSSNIFSCTSHKTGGQTAAGARSPPAPRYPERRSIREGLRPANLQKGQPRFSHCEWHNASSTRRRTQKHRVSRRLAEETMSATTTAKPRPRRPLTAAILGAATKQILWLCWAVGTAHFGVLFCASQVQAPNTPPWLLRASTLQRFLTYDMPLNQVPMVATHNSYNTEEEGVSTSWEVVPNQVFSITQQLACLGVRGLEIDVHFVEELIEHGRSELGATLVCHTRPSLALEVHAVCSQLHWHACEAAGLTNFGDDTGCSSSAPNLVDVFGEIDLWLNLPENKNELLYIKMETFVGTNADLLPNFILDMFGKDIIFSPLDFIAWQRTSGNEQWPSTENLVSIGKRLVFSSTTYQDTDVMFKISSQNHYGGLFYEDNKSAKRFKTTEPCSSRARDPSWSRVQGEASTWVVSMDGLVIFEDIPDPAEFLAATDVQSIIECGLTPTFDRMDSTMLEATMWSWEEGEPHTFFSGPRAAVAHQETGRWTSWSTLDNEESGGIRSYACRNGSSSGEWVMPGGVEGYFGGGEVVCLARGLTFGCPRTAKENAALRDAMTHANVPSVWLNLRSTGGDSASAWSRESGTTYELPTTFNHATCDGGSFSAAADFTWEAEDAWIHGDQAFFEKAERIREEARILRTEAAELVLLAAEQRLSQKEDVSAADLAEINELTAAAMLKEADRLEDAAREAGAFPKGW